MTEVNLHVYDVTNTAYDQANHFIMRMNNLTRDISVGGLFHGAVEVYGREWSFGFCEEGSGVYACIPKLNRQYTYRETVPLGRTKYCQREVNRLLRQMRDEWQGDSYDLLSRNCCHFCEEFCKRLGLEPLPRWLNRFATGADSAINAVQATCNQVRPSRAHDALFVAPQLL
uniref:Pppde thiol peptidase family isoform 1 n=1 Tax=Tetraselmis sp. GSL018 TaxID=582737 RepID=A0A061QLQ2_9CHLO|mmetsp:Transcript_2291/g.5403  ORF Transcript_2291/g.5403 Transcript_2291/m.5403 type:complete len:171 (+) Transcript_2291:161-673(+)